MVRLVTTQATLAAACYAVLIATAAAASKESLGAKLVGAIAASVGAFVSVCMINCYVTGGCGLLASVAAGVLVVALAGALLMAFDGKTETLVYRDGDEARKVPLAATPP